MSLRVFISTAVAHSQPQEAELAQRLISDVRNAGASVVKDDETIPDKQFLSFLEQELPRCDWLILLQTAEALRSLRSRATIYTALQLHEQNQIKGILQIICPSAETEEKPFSWPDTQSIVFYGDYPRVRDKMLLELGLLQIDDYISTKEVSQKLPEIHGSSAEIPTDQQGYAHKDIPAKIVRHGVIAKSIKQLRHRSAPLKQFLSPDTSVKKFVPSSIADVPTQPGAIHPKRHLRLLLALCFLLLLVSLSNGFLLFSAHHAQIPVTPTPVLMKVPSAATVRSTTPATLHPTPTRTSLAPTPTPTIPPPTHTPATPFHQILALDTFQRTDQDLWGTASDGQSWGGDANALTSQGIFSITGNTGQIANSAGTFEALLGPPTANADVSMSGMMNQFVGDIGAVNLGVVLRWQDTNHWYKALIDGNNLTIISSIPGATTNFTVLGQVAFPAQGNVYYTLRFRAVGTTLSAKVWPSGQKEPGNWLVTVKDKTFTSGQAGIRIVMQDMIQINITAFQEIRL